jgi:hypothetical protein
MADYQKEAASSDGVPMALGKAHLLQPQRKDAIVEEPRSQVPARAKPME